MIYLASPYSDPRPEIVQWRVDQAAKAARMLLQRGCNVYAPVVHGHYIERSHPEALPEKRWHEHGLDMIARCSSVWVLALPGWERSCGIRLEIERAREKGKETRLLSPLTLNFLEWGPKLLS